MTVFTLEELQQAARNHGMPLEALRYDVTPVGLHYLLIHFDIPAVDPESWRLEIGGKVARPLSLSLADLRARPSQEVTVTMECAGNGRARLEERPFSQPWLHEAVGTARWRGIPLLDVLDEADVGEGAREVVFTGFDRGLEGGEEQQFERSLTLDDARGDDVLLAYEINGQPLPPQHGFPLRLVVPGWYGMTNVKWLARITVVDEPFAGYQQRHAYRIKADDEDEGRPLNRIPPRALLIPPGTPEFPSRERTVPPGLCLLEGRAWSGFGPIAGVEVSTDGGESWHDADLDPPVSPWAWRGWRYRWEPSTPGAYELRCRARDDAGNVQPDEPAWNVGGYSNNAAQRVPVTVA
jgi:DMSO/TMAO reductase YedYZ molybdopterin-dependent catalytic subunit